MPRRRRNLPLWLRLVVRRLRSPEGKLAPLAVISIAVSVTLATGLEMASRSAQRNLDATAEAIVGSAKIEVTAGRVGLPEEVLEQVRAVPGVQAASPLVSAKLRLSDRDFALNVIGVDFVAEEVVRKTAIEKNGLQIRDPLRLLATSNSVVVTELLLDRLGLAEAYRDGKPAEIRVRAVGGETSLVVQGVLRPTGIAAAYSGQVALMDVYAAQALAGRTGLFDRIDIVPERDEDTDALISVIRSRLAGVATVQRSSARSDVAEDMLGMVRRSALMLAGAAALVACLLTHATTAQWVERQKRQLATLRAVGMEARRVQRMIFFEVSVLALVGTTLGVVGGVAISPPLMATLSKFLEVVAIEQLEGVSLQPSTLGLAVCVGLVASVAGSWLPARRAGTRFTLDSLDLATLPRTVRLTKIWIGSALLGVFALVSTLGRGLIDGGALIRVGSLLLLGAFAILALAPSILNSLGLALGIVQRSWPSVGHLATRFFRLRPWTFAVAVTAIATLVGTLVTIFLLIATIRSGIERWTESRFSDGAILVTPSPLHFTPTSDFLSPETIDKIRTTEGVAAASERYGFNQTVMFRGQPVQIAASSMEENITHAHLPSVGRTSSELAADLLRGEVAVSPGFVKAFGLTVGDTVDLDTKNGVIAFRIAGLFEDFGEKFGTILLDLATYDANWARPGASSAIVWPDAPPEQVISEIRRRVGDRQDLYFINASELVAANRQMTDVFTSTLHVLGAFISILGGIGVMILLAGIVAERRRELEVLRAAGGEPKLLATIVLVDALTLGFVGAACGLALGFACAEPASDILRETYGWILEQRWMAPELPFVIAGAVTAAVLGALVPARMAYSSNSAAVFGPE